MQIALYMLITQGILGALDTVIYHELKIGLPKQSFAKTELRLHAARDYAYAIVFGSLAFLEWNGYLAVIFSAILLFEVIITLWDFVEEDLTRKLPAGERIMHTIMAIIYGGFLSYLLPEIWTWWQQPTGFVMVEYGWLSYLLAVFGIGVFISGVRDLVASFQLK
ncbi:MAG: hypothetical protein JKY33_00690 [Bacteroidia bacterium]|nr:hypothetical protein [Bacteroidia bacterium]